MWPWLVRVAYGSNCSAPLGLTNAALPVRIEDGMAAGCDNYNTWDVSNVTSFSGLFRDGNRSAFNHDINGWNTSQVTRMDYTFGVGFNTSVANWNVSNVVDMDYIFSGHSLHQNLSAWDVSAVTTMNGAFYDTDLQHADLHNWDLRSLSALTSTFARATVGCDIGLSSWNTSQLTQLGETFSQTHWECHFGLSSWDTSRVQLLEGTFEISNFNQNINGWDTSRITVMYSTFFNTHVYNQPMHSWNTSSATHLFYVFDNATAFNQDINSWDIRNTTTLVNVLDGTHMDCYPTWADHTPHCTTTSTITTTPTTPFNPFRGFTPVEFRKYSRVESDVFGVIACGLLLLGTTWVIYLHRTKALV